MEIGLNDMITLVKEDTYVTGRIDGLRLKLGALEEISIDHIDMWFYMSDGWQIAVEGDSDEIQPE